MAEQYPKAEIIGDGATPEQLYNYFKIYSVTYNVAFYFLPYNIKLTDGLNIRWNEQTVFGRMDPIATYKGMGRTIQVGFEARGGLYVDPYKKGSGGFAGPELLHSIDHLKKTLYPRYNSNSIMISPPLFRLFYKNLIVAGQNTISSINDDMAGVLCYITSFSANPKTEVNKIYYDSNGYAFPKVFDVSLTVTVLNENLTNTQQKGVLNDPYFYDYQSDNHHAIQENEQQINGDIRAGEDPVNEEQKALADELLASGAITLQDYKELLNM